MRARGRSALETAAFEVRARPCGRHGMACSNTLTPSYAAAHGRGAVHFEVEPGRVSPNPVVDGLFVRLRQDHVRNAHSTRCQHSPDAAGRDRRPVSAPDSARQSSLRRRAPFSLSGPKQATPMISPTHCPLAQRGHSRDGKQGTLQIVFGLLCTAAGCPVAVEVFEG